MNKFLSELEKKGLLKNLVEIIDWLFDDHKFDNYTSDNKKKLTNRIKKLPGLTKESYICDSKKHLVFPSNSKKSITIIISQGNSQSEDLIRHLRNGIAHGHAKCLAIKGIDYIEIKDFGKSKESKENDYTNQSAYILLPLDYLSKIYTFFTEIKNEKKNH